MTTCDTCSREFAPARSDARYCSGRCRTIAYRKRNEPERPAQSKRRRVPLPDAWRSAAYELDKAVGRIGRLTADDRLPRNLDVIRDANVYQLIRARDQIDAAIAELLQIDEPVTDTPEGDGPRPFKKSDTESLDEITGSVANMVDLVQLVRPGQVEHDDALRMATRARVAWQRIDRRLSAIVTPPRRRPGWD